MAALPENYRKALLLRREGLSDVVVALRLGIPAESANALLVLAEAKFARLIAAADAAPDDHEGECSC